MEVKLTRDVYVQAATAEGVVTGEGAAEEAPKKQSRRKAAAK